MAIVYNWEIPTLEYYPHKDGFQQVVYVIHWVLVGVDGQYQSSVYGTQSLNTSDLNPDQYVVYDDLTQNIVEGWLEDAMGADRVQSLRDIIAKNINDMINPPNVVTNPPWTS